MSITSLLAPAVASLALLLIACDRDPIELAPRAAALEAKEPAASATLTLAIEKPSSKVSFLMDAPLEKIRGVVDGASSGALYVDPHDLGKSTGLVTVSINGLELFQTVEGENGKPRAEQQNGLQNQHARAWLEISDDAPEKDRKENARVEFKVEGLEQLSASSLLDLSGSERRVSALARGELRLHGRKSPKTVELAMVFRYQGEKLVSASISTSKPVTVNLDEHDVRPRERFGKLAQKTLEALAPKVAKEARVRFELTAIAQ